MRQITKRRHRMRFKRSAVLITCSLLLVIFATACSSTAGTTTTNSTTTQQANSQANGTTQLNNQNNRDGQASVQATPVPTKASNETQKGNDKDDQGISKSAVQATPTPV